MNNLTILTQRYKQELESINNIRCRQVGKELYMAEYPISTIDTKLLTALAALLERIVILGHPVYGHSQKLTDMAFEMSRNEIANISNLKCYLGENTVLHLEGYTAFRMSDYRNRLDMMMYCLIKKMKLAESLL